jgi:hypothetical protein
MFFFTNILTSQRLADKHLRYAAQQQPIIPASEIASVVIKLSAQENHHSRAAPAHLFSLG